MRDQRTISRNVRGGATGTVELGAEKSTIAIALALRIWAKPSTCTFRASYRAETRQTPTSILGTLVFWFVFIIAIVMATDALGIRQVSAVLGDLIAYIPSVIAAVLILILAALLANFLAGGIIRGATGSDILATAARVAIIVYAVFAALTQLGIAVQLTANTLLIVLGGVALAAAIAFGFGGPECCSRHRREGLRAAQGRGEGWIRCERIFETRRLAS